MKAIVKAATSFFVVAVLSGCVTTGKVVTNYSDGTVSTVEFRKGVFDDLDVPATDANGNKTSPYVRIGTSKVAAETAFKMFQYSGDSLRRYAVEQAGKSELSR